MGKPSVVCYVSRTGTVSSAGEKRTVSKTETYIPGEGNVEKASTEGGQYKDVF